MHQNKLSKLLTTRMGYIFILVFFTWLKTIFVYLTDFELGVNGFYQYLVLFFNPIGFSLLVLSIALYVRRTYPFYILATLLHIANSALLIFNVIYYREFTDFMTFNVIFGYSKVSQGLSGSSFALLNPIDIFLILDFVLLIIGFLCKIIKLDTRPIIFKKAAATTVFSLFILMFNLTLGEISRPQLLSRTFDRNYLVKYLGIDAFTIYDGVKTVHNNQQRSEAVSSDLNSIIQYTRKNYATPNKKMFGIAKGKNIIVIHLESFQQFLINYKLDNQEVTPFLNSLYNGKETYSFANFFNQVGQGKTSDAENMLETGTFGLSQGSLFSALGSDNTFEAAPAILKQYADYTSAVFHGNKGSFWNRNNVYKNMGYQYFFDASYYNQNANNLSEYGLKDKLLFNDSVKYLQHLQQPFYAKFITVSNHFPFELDKKNTSFPAANTGDSSVDNYFVTAHYLDQAVKEFFDYLKASGLYDNSVIVLYGDHYGISNTRNLKLASLLGKNSSTWSDFDNAQMQRVPFMIHIPGNQNGGIQKQYGGEIDVLPTLLHLVGIDSQKFIQFGSDLFSKNHKQVVAFRNQRFVTSKYTVTGKTIYLNSTGEVVTHPDKRLREQIKHDREYVNTVLSMSDTLNNKNLLRFYVPTGFTPVDPSQYEYKNQYQRLLEIENKLKNKSTSLYSKKGNKSTEDMYKSDAPELTTSDTKEANESSISESEQKSNVNSSHTNN